MSEIKGWGVKFRNYPYPAHNKWKPPWLFGLKTTEWSHILRYYRHITSGMNSIPPKRRRIYPVSVVNFVRMRFILYSHCPHRCPPGSSWAFARVHKSSHTKHAARLQPLLATTFPPLGSVSGVEPVGTKISFKSVQLVTSRISST